MHKAEDRGAGEHGWLSTRYSFSFADWFEPSRMGFGALRVINDDTMAPSSGFPMHAHKDMEIITVVMRGAVTHKDSLGNTGTVKAGEVQAMSAGTGVVHSEYNASEGEPLELFQIWILPRHAGMPPRYAQKSFKDAKGKGGLTLLVGPDTRGGALPIYQDAYISLATLRDHESLVYQMQDKKHGAYFFVIDGEVDIEWNPLSARDAIGITGKEEVRIEARSSARILVIEVPM